MSFNFKPLHFDKFEQFCIYGPINSCVTHFLSVMLPDHIPGVVHLMLLRSSNFCHWRTQRYPPRRF